MPGAVLGIEDSVAINKGQSFCFYGAEFLGVIDTNVMNKNNIGCGGQL